MHNMAQPRPTASEYLDSWERRVSEWGRVGDSSVLHPNPPYDRADAPRPLVLHLTLAAASAARAASDAAGLSPELATWLASPTSAPTMRPEAIDPAFGTEVGLVALERLQLMLDGIHAYRNHPWRRPPQTQPELWRRGATRLIDYSVGGEGLPLLVIPSLVNRATVLDLLPRRSLLNWLAARGHRPLLLDWGTPGPAETNFGVDDYVRDRLLPAAEHAAADGALNVLGYCMGGIFTIALANLRPHTCERLALIASPWDFHAPLGVAGCLRELTVHYGIERFDELLALVGRVTGGLPVEFLQGIFALLDPNLAARKFAKFAKLNQRSVAARVFVATEDWLNDSTPLTANTARDVLVGWCLENRLQQDQWRIDDVAIRPETVRHPALVVASRTDRIAPPASVAVLGERLPAAKHVEIDAGHVGMMVGSSARKALWQPMHKWLLDTGRTQRARSQAKRK